MKEKLITHSQYRKALDIVTKYRAQIETRLEEITQCVYGNSKFINVTADTKLYDVGCSVRLNSALRLYDAIHDISHNGTVTVADLSKISVREFMKCRNTGNRTLRELKELCYYAGISLQP